MERCFLHSSVRLISLGLAILFGSVFNQENGYWSGLTIAISFSAQRQAIFREANARAQGTALWSVYGVLGCYFFVECPQLRILALLPWIIFTSFLRHSTVHGQAGGISTVIGALLILGRKNYGPPAEFSITRLTEAFIGLFCFITVEILLPPTRAATLAKKATLAKQSNSLRAWGHTVNSSTKWEFARRERQEYCLFHIERKKEKLKVHVNELEKFAGETELEPNIWFLPFRFACYSKLLASISKKADLLHFLVIQMEALVEESQRFGVAWRELQEQLNSDLYLFKKDVSSSLHFLLKITSIESFSVFEREEKDVYDDRELGKSPNAGVCNIVDIEKIESSFLYHSNEVTEKFWAKEGEERSKSQMALCQNAIKFCTRSLMRETKEVEKGINELVQWENASNCMNFNATARKIHALFPE